MTHRARRPPATLPARRGMRASWFRGRAPHEPEVPVEAGVQPPPDAGTSDPAAGTDVPQVGPDVPPAAGPDVPPVRAAFGHPTF